MQRLRRQWLRRQTIAQLAWRRGCDGVQGCGKTRSEGRAGGADWQSWRARGGGGAREVKGGEGGMPRALG